MPAIDSLPWSGDALDRLSELREARDLIEWMIDRAIEECRSVYPAITHERIGDALGISRQAAQKRASYVRL